MSLSTVINKAKNKDEVLNILKDFYEFLENNIHDLPAGNNQAIAINYLKLFIKQEKINPIYENKLELVFSTLIEIEKILNEKGLFMSNEKFSSIHKLPNGIYVQSQWTDDYEKAENEFVRINEKYNITEGARFIISSEDDFSDDIMPERQNVIDNAIPLKDFEKKEEINSFSTVDECLAKVEKQEAAKSSVKTPSL